MATEVHDAAPAQSLLAWAAHLPGWAGPAATAAAAAAVCTVVSLVDPNQPGRYPTCPFLAVTGKWCPGCGSLRGLNALLRADLGAAAGFNVLMVAAVPFLIYRWIRWTFGRPRRRVGAPSAVPIWILFAVVLAFWVLRNVPTLAALAP